MLFNSLDFAIFLPVVFLLYWFVFNKNLRWQNILLIVASYVFYGWWDWRFLILIFFSTVVDFVIGKLIFSSKEKARKKFFLWVSIIANIGLLGLFKYYNFFLENFKQAFSVFGQELNSNSLNIILPVGISFYTFQTLSYSLDIYKQRIKPTEDFISFMAFVSFFPQLVAGPIERAKNFLPQFLKRREFKYCDGVAGLRQILWGLFKKLVIADNCSVYVNYIFENSSNLSGSTLLFGAVLFTFQLYGDFSGYSDIAIGTGKLFGFNLMQNFAFPFFARDIPEFWRRWHISLTTWFRDYVYMPLVKSGTGQWMRVRNIFILFILTGFWHGASWTFIGWGALNAFYFLPFLLIRKVRSATGIVGGDSNIPGFREVMAMFFTFLLNTFGIIFFRAQSIGQTGDILKTIFSPSLFQLPYFPGIGLTRSLILILSFFMLVEWFGRREQYAIEKLPLLKSQLQRFTFYGFLICLIGIFMYTAENEFIYFQF